MITQWKRVIQRESSADTCPKPDRYDRRRRRYVTAS
jgi:hypothetical protein